MIDFSSLWLYTEPNVHRDSLKCYVCLGEKLFLAFDLKM